MIQPFHFKNGMMGRLATFFVRAAKRPEPIEETIVAPVMFSVASILLAANGKIPVQAVVPLLVLITLLAGAWFGAMRGLDGSPRGAIRGLFVGGLIAIGAYISASRIETSVGWPKLAGLLIYLVTGIYWCGHVVAGSVRDLCLITEQQWQAGASRRTWVSRVFWMIVRWKIKDDASKSEMLVVRITQLIFLSFVLDKGAFALGSGSGWKIFKLFG